MKRAALALVAAVAAAPAAAQEGLPLATVIVPRQQHIDFDFQIEMLADERGSVRTREEWRGYRWIAVRTSGSDVQRITSEECPVLSEMADAFRRLPAIQPATTATVVRDEPLPVNVIMLHGFGVEVRFKTFSGAQVSVTGNDAWAAWGNDVVRSLWNCWPGEPSTSD